MTENHGKILVVDDNRLNRLKLARGLENQGHEAVLAENGRQAFEFLEEQEFDLILLDILMPEMDGYQVLEKLIIDPKLKEIPVIVISAIDEMESIVKCIEMGAEDYLPKPFNSVLLKARIGAILEKKQLRDKERLYAKSLERELEIGRHIQNSFFPESLPQIEDWEIATHFQAAGQVSGDFYDAFILENGGGLSFVIADVCGKGVGAALFMGLFRSLIRAFSQLHYGMGLAELFHNQIESHSNRTLEVQRQIEFNHPRALEIILSHTNNYIARTHGKTNMFATMFWGIIDPAAGTLYYINGGHESPVIVGSEGIRTKLEPTGPAVGMLPDMKFEAKRISINPGESLVAFTDGVTEARGADSELYGEDKLMQLLNIPTESVDDLICRIAANLAEHTAGAEQTDDITILGIRRS